MLRDAYNRAYFSLSRYCKDRRGNFVMTFALSLVPIMGATAAAVDYSNVVRVKTELQDAVDGSVLAAAKEFSESLDYNKLKPTGEDYFDVNFVTKADVTGTSYDLYFGASGDINSDGESTGMSIVATATTTYHLNFGGFVNMRTMTITRNATVNVASATIETAFVFDASGSMTDNDTFEKSTHAAHELLHGLKQYALAMRNATGATTSYARYALVPFAWGVNVGAANKSASWMDTLGEAAHHHDHFDWTQGVAGATATGSGWKDGTEWLTRWTLFSEANDSWKGCVEARAYPHFLDDTTPDALDSDTLVVPHFYPDEPDNKASGEIDFDNSYADDTVVNATTNITLNGSNSGNEAKQIKRQSWTSKYNKWAFINQFAKDGKGPNRNCFDYAIVPLNDDFGTTNSEISQLNLTFSKTHNLGSGDDDGATNIQQGMVWGWRTLSPEVPMTGGRANDDPQNRKVAILISDGINSYGLDSSENGSQYGALGFAADGRLEEGIATPALKTARDMMDEHTLTTCTNMKKAGIEIFVVGYGVADGSREQTLLENCSGGDVGNQYYYSVDDSNVEETMIGILRQLIDMRLTS